MKQKMSISGIKNPIEAEGSGNFFEIIGNVPAKAGKKQATLLRKSPGRDL